MKMSNASCLLLLVLGVLVAAAAAHPRQHDPCKWNDERGYTFVAETGEELDEEAMKKLPEAYIQYGWRHYRSGKCSYKGWEQHCPDYWHNKHGRHHFDEHWWDTHFSEAKCLGAHCTGPSGCCSKNCADGFCCAAEKQAIDGPCDANSDCCSGQCTSNTAGTNGVCCIPSGSPIQCTSTLKCCDSGATCNTFSATDKRCCLKLGETCATSSVDLWKAGKKCCSGKCGKVTETSGNRTCCLPKYEDCTAAAECCSGTCNSSNKCT